MTSLEAYILKQYGRWVDFEICTKELGFNVEDAVALTIEKKSSIDMVPSDVWLRKPRKTGYKYRVPVMSTLAVRGDCLLFTELAKLLDLNMHFQPKGKR